MKKQIIIIGIAILFMASNGYCQEKVLKKEKGIQLGVLNQSIAMILREMAKSDGISRDEAISTSFEICHRLWGKDPLLKVLNCDFDEEGQVWTTVLFCDNGLDGWAAKTWIGKTGHLQKVEYLPGM